MNDTLIALTHYLAMGGYGVYVWGSLGMCAAVMAAEVLWLRSRRQALLHESAPHGPATPGAGSLHA